MKRFHFLWSYVSRWKWKLVVSSIGLAFVSVTSLLYPWLLKLMVDQIGEHSVSAVRADLLCLILLCTFLASTLIGYFQQLQMQRLGYLLRNAIRQSFFESLLQRPLQFHRQSQVGELSARATEDIGKLQTLFSSLVSPAIQNSFFVVGCLALMASLNWVATLMVVGIIAASIPFVFGFSKTLRKLSALSQTEHARANARFEESLVAIREMKAFVREKLESRRYGSLLSQAFEHEIHASALHIRINQTVYFLVSALLLAIFYTGTRRNLFPDWSLGGVIAFYFYSYTLTMSLISIGKIQMTYQSVVGAMNRVMELLHQDIPPDQSPRTAHPLPVRGKVRFDNVSFSYEEEKPVLVDVSLTIESGEWILISGPSGSGKSTLTNLLMGFYQPASGSVCIDDVPIEEWEITSLRSQIGFVGQDPILIHGSLRDNISFYDTTAREDDLQQAIEMSCLTELVQSLPNGLETIVGERGYTLSGGQKARMAIARAILFNPKILILDEANVVLEENLEVRLWQNLINLRGQKTTIILSHHSENIPKIFTTVELRDKRLVRLQPVRGILPAGAGNQHFTTVIR